MKISLMIEELEPAGAQRQLVALANALAARGHQVSVDLLRAQGQLLDTLDPAIHVHDFAKGGKGDIIGFLFRTIQYYQSNRPDVLYTFLVTPDIVGAIIKIFIPSIRLIWSLRASNMDLSQYSLVSRFAYWLERQFSHKPDGIIANSEAGRKVAAGKGFPEARIVSIPNGIDTDNFVPDRDRGATFRAQWAPDPNTTLIGIIARLDPMKGHSILLHALEHARRTDDSLRLVCIGDGPLEEGLKRLCEKLGLVKHVVWAGSCKDMVAAYNALDLACLSSIFGEGFPNVIGEAMSCGVPCTATDVGDTARVVGDTGIIVNPNDVLTLAEALLQGRSLRKTHGANCRQRIQSHFSLKEMVDKTEQELLSSLSE